ncbi:zinc metalloprotease [Humibacillus sp. DSM 29435]|uniref:zinc metalloprotease n=1 Tax=Humibacillus sp. DSM 29435 TaxID=1869167 RepID=UPI0015869B50|nr:zinc metalloprotease [Humibacillus sp. DSM 29435]
MAGYAGVDPNSMSLAQSKTWDAALQQRVQQRGLATRAATAKFKTITIDVRVHVITRNNGTGGATPKMVLDQIKVLNRAYAGKTASGSAFTPFRFVLKSYDVTPNTNWYNWSDSDDKPAKKALHRGGYDDLNMYVTGLSDGLLGYAYYPQDQVGFRDGVVLLNESLPGGSAAPYNEGDTATHEIGHWLGLAHTFENGCSKPGDFVADTPYQADGDNIFYCDESLNTCQQPGKDPVHNFMSYGDDPCLDQFTEGQSLRMLLSWLAYRDPAV